MPSLMIERWHKIWLDKFSTHARCNVDRAFLEMEAGQDAHNDEIYNNVWDFMLICVICGFMLTRQQMDWAFHTKVFQN